MDYASPKHFSRIWEYLKRNRICAKNAFWVYLDGLVEKGLVIKVKAERKTKLKHGEKPRKDRFLYALADWKKHHEFQRKYEEVMRADLKRIQKAVDKMVAGIEKGLLEEDEITDFVIGMLTDFEYRQLLGFDVLLRSKGASAFVAPSLIEDFIVIPYNLRIQLLWLCNEKYPKAIEAAVRELVKRKMVMRDLYKYPEILYKLGIEIKPRDKP
jgi:hypothetical protein